LVEFINGISNAAKFYIKSPAGQEMVKQIPGEKDDPNVIAIGAQLVLKAGAVLNIRGSNQQLA